MEYLIPTASEVKDWLNLTVRHVCHVEYYLHNLKISTPDPERPHDLVGPGNKFEWSVIRGFALQKRAGIDFNTHILPSLMDHRRQYHHRMWNDPEPGNQNLPKATASPVDLQVGAIDALCSLREPRDYQGGVHSWEEVAEIIAKNPPHKIPWMQSMMVSMREIKEPTIDKISIHTPVDVDLDIYIELMIYKRLNEVTKQLFDKGGMYEGQLVIS
jgi:hypothetical protein